MCDAAKPVNTNLDDSVGEAGKSGDAILLGSSGKSDLSLSGGSLVGSEERGGVDSADLRTGGSSSSSGSHH